MPVLVAWALLVAVKVLRVLVVVVVWALRVLLGVVVTASRETVPVLLEAVSAFLGAVHALLEA